MEHKSLSQIRLSLIDECVNLWRLQETAEQMADRAGIAAEHNALEQLDEDAAYKESDACEVYNHAYGKVAAEHDLPQINLAIASIQQAISYLSAVLEPKESL
jgi:hypothetical protein